MMNNIGRNMKAKGFTLVELLTVLVVVAVLAGLLVPALNMVKNTARVARQKSQFIAMEQALLAFKADHGDYPPSVTQSGYYTGSHKLAEAMVGMDGMGFRPETNWSGNLNQQDEDGLVLYRPSAANFENNMKKRQGPYLEAETANAFKLNDIYDNSVNLNNFNRDWLVLCDTFTNYKANIPNGTETIVEKVGTPILYYKADTQYNTIDDSYDDDKRVYNYYDNKALVDIGKLRLADERHVWAAEDTPFSTFYEDSIRDVKKSANLGVDVPYRPDSFILISAGPDGIFGNKDDVRNFGN